MNLSLSIAFLVMSPAPPQKAPAIQPPSRQAVEAIANRHIQANEPKLAFENKRSIAEIRRRLASSKSAGAKPFEKTVNDAVSNLSLAMTQMKSPASLLVASSTLALQAPNERTYNLLGSMLHQIDRKPEAVTVLGTASQMAPKDFNILLNLAVAELDAGRLPQAKALLEKIVRKNPNEKRAWKSLAAYWYQKGDYNRSRDCLWRAATFKGFVRKKIEKRVEEVFNNEVKPGDSESAIESKLAKLANSKPITTAEAIEEIEPELATRIRQKYEQLPGNELATLPTIPIANTVQHKAFVENRPMVEGWVGVFGDEFLAYQESRPGVQDILSAGSEAGQQQAAAAFGQKEAAAAMQQAMENMKFLKGMKVPGMSPGQIDSAMKQVEAQAKKHGIKTTAPAAGANGEVPPGFDHGSPLAKLNYANYIVVRHAYEAWFQKFMLREYKQKEADILKHYAQQMEPEMKLHNEKVERHEKEIERKEEVHLSESCKECLAENARHKGKVNSIGADHFKQWSNLYFPQYAQKMKPTLEAYWRTCMLYVRCMRQKSVMEREYNHVRDVFHTYALQAGSGIATGLGFEYLTITEQEQAALDEAQAASEEKFQVDVRPRTLQEFDAPKDDWVKWIGDHLSAEFAISVPPPPALPPAVASIGLKVSATSIEIEPYAFGLGAGAKYDWVKNKFETYNSIGHKSAFTLTIGGVGVKMESRSDFIRKTATWDFEKGTYKESYATQSEMKAAVGSMSGSVRWRLDPSLHSNVEVKATAKAAADGVDHKASVKASWDF